MTEEKKAWYEGIPAPVDADRNVVPLTTQVMFGRRGDAYSMDRFSFDIGTKSWIAYFERRGSSDSTEVSNLRLKRPVVQGLSQPDSWERLSDDLGRYNDTKVMCEYFGLTADGTCDGCRAHSLRARHPGRSCIAFALDDVVSRVRALRGEERDED